MHTGGSPRGGCAVCRAEAEGAALAPQTEGGVRLPQNGGRRLAGRLLHLIGGACAYAGAGAAEGLGFELFIIIL